MAALVARLSAELGKPYYDQLIEGRFGSGRATLRRAAWRTGQHTLEVRQLTPLLGGPLFVTLSDGVALKAISAAGDTASGHNHAGFDEVGGDCHIGNRENRRPVEHDPLIAARQEVHRGFETRPRKELVRFSAGCCHDIEVEAGNVGCDTSRFQRGFSG